MNRLPCWRGFSSFHSIRLFLKVTRLGALLFSLPGGLLWVRRFIPPALFFGVSLDQRSRALSVLRFCCSSLRTAHKNSKTWAQLEHCPMSSQTPGLFFRALLSGILSWFPAKREDRIALPETQWRRKYRERRTRSVIWISNFPNLSSFSNSINVRANFEVRTNFGLCKKLHAKRFQIRISKLGNMPKSCSVRVRTTPTPNLNRRNRIQPCRHEQETSKKIEKEDN